MRINGTAVVASIGGNTTAIKRGPADQFDCAMTGTTPTTKETYTEDCTMTITNRFGEEVYVHNPRMRGRGNSTWGAPKKPFKVRSRNTLQTPFGFPPSRDWALMADYYDQSFIRSSVAFHVYREATGRWAPRSEHVWVDWPGSTTCNGLYRYSETVDVQPNRIDIREMEDTDISGNELTGPYFVETDQYYDSPGFKSTLDTPVMWDTPEEPTVEQIAYMQNWVNQTEDILINGTAEQIVTRIDIDSFVDWYLLMEFAKNWEARWAKSIKWMKDQDAPNGTGKAMMVTPWDLDLSFGLSWGGSTGDPATGWAIQNYQYAGGGGPGAAPNWLYYLWERCPAFRTAAIARWNDAFVPAIDSMWPWYDRMIQGLEGLITADRTLWGMGGNQPSGHTAPVIRQWIIDRAQWITDNIGL